VCENQFEVSKPYQYLSEFQNGNAREQWTQETGYNKRNGEGFITKGLVIRELSLCSVGIAKYCKMSEARHAAGMKNAYYILAQKITRLESTWEASAPVGEYSTTNWVSEILLD
jgi:hypothetical protein